MTSPVDIRPDHLEIVQGILREHLPAGVRVWVFGSRANWTTKDSSDLDLALEGKGKLGQKLLGALKDAFEDSAVPYTVDVVDLSRIGDSFRQIVESQSTPLPLDGHGAGHTPSNSWRKVTLGEVMSFANGKSSPGRSDDSLYSVYGSNGIIGKSNEVNSDANTIVIGRVGSYCGSLYFSNEDCWVTDNAIMAKAIDENDSKFFFYLLQSLGLNEWRAGSGQPLLNQIILSSIPATIPPPPEQRAIAHVLGTLDDKIELNRRMNETLEAMARALFKSWFVDFEPVRAKMKGRWRRGESLPGLPTEHYDLFPDRLVDSELGEIPEGWEVKRIDEIAERVAMGPFGSSIKVATFVNNGIPVISGQHLGGTLLEDNEYNFITEAHAEKLANANVKRGDIVFTHAGSIGQAAYIPPSSQFERYVISQRQFYMRCDTTKISPLFVVHYFKTRDGQHQLLANTSSTGVPSIARPVTYLRSIELCVPPEATWRKFDKIAGAFHSNIACNTEESSCLATQRDALLPGLVSGEVKVYKTPNNAGSAS